MVIGPNPIAKFGKNVAELCGFLDYKEFALHSFQRMHVSNNINNNAPTKEQQNHLQHYPQSKKPYVTLSALTKQKYQSVVRVCKNKDREGNMFDAKYGKKEEETAVLTQQQQPKKHSNKWSHTYDSNNNSSSSSINHM